uniref:SWIM-type domain-containing protein n=1 Tax=Rhipicephalus appendiculatus TaxID=34631 RepID=A0A131YJ81_RHIAP
MAASCKIETADRFPVAVPVSSICKYVNKACERSPCLRDGEAAYEAGDVIECSVEAIRGGRVNIHARVLHPGAPLSPPHRVAVTLERNDVTEALCTCKAGSYKCGHVVAVLLHLHARQLLAQPSVQCQGPHVSVKKEKQNKKNEPKETLDLPRIDKLTIDDAPDVADDISRRPLQNRLHKSTSPVPTKHAPECVQGRQQSKEESQPEPAPNTLKAAIRAIVHTAKQAKNKPSVEQIFKKLCEQHHHDDVKIIERATREQSCSELWFEHRVGMITASVAYSVFTRVNTIRTKAGPHDLRALLRVLMRESRVTNEDMQRGITLEPVAKEAYKNQNTHHKGLQLHDCGLSILRGKPFIGASPDAIITCECCSPRLLEVKCPRSLERFTEYEVVYQGGKMQLKQNSRYFCQTQVQMGVTELPSTEVFVYVSDAENMTLNVTFLQDYFDEVVERATFFFKHYVLPHMLELAE